MKKEPEKKKSFGGKLVDFKDAEERAFEQKHFKAYLRGDTKFAHGRDDSGRPIYHPVKIIWN